MDDNRFHTRPRNVLASQRRRQTFFGATARYAIILKPFNGEFRLAASLLHSREKKKNKTTTSTVLSTLSRPIASKMIRILTRC